jgi:hypothetical protein
MAGTKLVAIFASGNLEAGDMVQVPDTVLILAKTEKELRLAACF